MNRRVFLKRSCSTCLAVATLPWILEGCATVSNAQGKLTSKGLVLPIEAFVLKQGENISYRSSLVVSNEKLKYPIYIHRINEREYNALWMQCTHQGAELQSVGERLQCAAHGSEFDRDGLVLNGPADMRLRSFPVTVNGDELFIDLQKKI